MDLGERHLRIRDICMEFGRPLTDEFAASCYYEKKHNQSW